MDDAVRQLVWEVLLKVSWLERCVRGCVIGSSKTADRPRGAETLFTLGAMRLTADALVSR